MGVPLIMRSLIQQEVSPNAFSYTVMPGIARASLYPTSDTPNFISFSQNSSN